MSSRAKSLTRRYRRLGVRGTVAVRRHAHRRALVDLIVEHLPPLQAKIRRRMVAQLVEHIAEREGELELFLELDGLSRLIATVLHVRHVVPVLEQQHDALVQDFMRFARRHDALSTAGERRRLLAERLRRTSTSAWRLRGDRAALRRYLDLGALKERHDGERHERLVLVELALDFIGGALQAIAEVSEAEAADTHQLLRDSDLAPFLVGQLERAHRWQTRRAAMQALGALVRAGIEPTRARVEILREHLDDDHEHPWVQAAIADVLWRIDPPRIGAVTHARLAAPRPHPLDFLVRRILIDRIDRDRAAARELLAAQLEAPDPTEHVRIGLVAVAQRLAAEDDTTVAWLAHAVGLEPGQGDPSARVRAHAARALVQHLEALRPQTEPTAVAAAARDHLVAWLAHERDGLPLQVALERLRVVIDLLADTEAAGVEVLAPLLDPLLVLSAADEVPAAIHEEAAATLEALDRARDPDRHALVVRLRSTLARARVPGSCRVALPAQTSTEGIGRALAEVARDDWGIEATVSRRRLRLHRGDRFATKLWRILHELRHPAPNKRQGFRHTIGRRLRGPLRAHSGRLDEVTPTVVPGERVHVRQEGGWGRHVPTVDDASSLPLLGSRPVELYSSFGVTRLRPTGSLLRRLRARLRLTLGYAELAAQRTSSLAASEPEERRRYLTTLRDRFGVEVEIEPPPPTDGHARRLPARITSMLPQRSQASAAVVVLPSWVPDWMSGGAVARLDEWLSSHAHYFLSLQANEQASLSAFFLGAFAVFFGDSFRRRRSIDHARAKIPLCIGGWGTRGKSGTERIKAGLFHGLGYEVFSKTTGCEAMMIHSIPEGPSSEVFVFRPYGKATIWEQRTLLELGAALRAEVFLWECMALNPRYVEILQHRWMRDDLSTLTNAYPDHEDIQGPAGIDVANAISSFIPRRGTVVTSEINFLPLFREVSRRRDTTLVALDPREGDLVASELLALFPYQEHPRNIALVAEMAQRLGIDRDLAIVMMAQHVVPDLGVLKRYPKVRVRGRVLEFINGCSANERAGFLANWERTGCAALADDEDPAEVVITVVNNRDDRISRSEVFARILVGDTVVDRHVLIGTNLRGLLAYIRTSLATYLEGILVVRPEELGASAGRGRAQERLRTTMRRLRIHAPQPAAMLRCLRTWAAGCELAVTRTEAIEAACAALLASEGALELSKVRAQVERDRDLKSALEAGLSSRPPEGEDSANDGREGEGDPTSALPQGSRPDSARRELLGPCTRADLLAHFHRQLARSIVHARLQRRLEGLDTAAAIDRFHAELREAYRELFEDLLVVVDDPLTKGDVIIQTCARSVPPGTQVRIMGTQNIKGTGLDFVYRWLAIDQVLGDLGAYRQGDATERVAALERLEAFADHGVLDLSILAAFLSEHEPGSAAEQGPWKRLQGRVQPAFEKRQAALQALDRAQAQAGSGKKKGWIESAAGWVEGWLDFLDGARRFHRSRGIMKDLVMGRVSHPRAAVLMREIYAREKGGWLYQRIAGRS